MCLFFFSLFFSLFPPHLFSLSSSSFQFLFDLLVGGGYFYFYNDDLKEEKKHPHLIPKPILPTRASFFESLDSPTLAPERGIKTSGTQTWPSQAMRLSR